MSVSLFNHSFSNAREAHIVSDINLAVPGIAYQYRESDQNTRETHSTGFMVPAS
jgi:hypothetical protein